MFLALWNYLRGYVIIKVYGFSVERFVNLAAFKGIFLWDIKPEKAWISMKVSIHGFKDLRECARKTRCRVKIIEKKGLPFVLNKYRKRKLLACGALLFVIALYILSSFIWTVRIEGNDRISYDDIMKTCYDIGIKPGNLKSKFSTKDAAAKLIEMYNDISWVSVKVTGTKAEVKIVETIPKPEIIDKSTPSDIVASKPGIIVSIATSSGIPKVKQKDVVEEGDLLVSGEVAIKDGDTEISKEYVRSESVVKAKLWYEFNNESELNYTEKEYTGKVKGDISFVFYDNNINILKPNIKFKEYDFENAYEKYFAIGDYVFPMGIVKNEYKEYNLVKKTRTPEEAKAIISKSLNEEINKILKEDSNLVDVSTDYTETSEKISAKSTVTVIERIDKEIPIQNNGRNQVDGSDGKTGDYPEQ